MSTTSSSEMDAFMKFNDEQNNPKKATTATGGTPRISSEEKKKKYFSPQEKTEYFRLLPNREGEAPFFQVAHFHEVNVNGQNKKLVCLNHYDGSECPICKEAEKVRTDGFNALKAIREENKELVELVASKNASEEEVARLKSIEQPALDILAQARKLEAKEFYIARGIDMGKTGDGVKFWRFKKHFKQQGVYDKMVPWITRSFKEGKNVADVENGAAFEITTIEAMFGKIKYREVSGIMLEPSSPLSTSAAKVTEWVNDPITWREIYTPVTIKGHMDAKQYLQAVVEGRAPQWDEINKKWKTKDANGNTIFLDIARTESGSSDNVPVSDLRSATSFDPSSVESADDLPF